MDWSAHECAMLRGFGRDQGEAEILETYLTFLLFFFKSAVSGKERGA